MSCQNGNRHPLAKTLALDKRPRRALRSRERVCQSTLSDHSSSMQVCFLSAVDYIFDKQSFESLSLSLYIYTSVDITCFSKYLLFSLAISCIYASESTVICQVSLMIYQK